MNPTMSSTAPKKTREIRRPTLRRHVIVVLLLAALIAIFGQVHGQWSPMHRWNRAFGDASLVLVALSFGIGPLSRLYRRAVRLVPYRREMGIYAFILALIHGIIILVGWVQYDLMRLSGFEFHPQLQKYVMFQQGFALGNALGIVALILALLLAATSSDFALRKLGASGWKFIQMGVLPLWWLTVAHVAYFLYAHFLSFHRNVPEPNPLQIPFAILVVAVLVLRIVSYVRTVRAQNRRAKPDVNSGSSTA